MFNKCHIHLRNCTWLNVFSHAQYLLIKLKNIFKCFSYFWKVFYFSKNVKNFKNSVALFWRLSRELAQSRTLVASPYRDFSRLTGNSLAGKCFSHKKGLEYFSKICVFMLFAAQVGDLFVGGRSICEGYIEIFAAQIVTLSQVKLPVVKNTSKIFEKFFFQVF